MNPNDSERPRADVNDGHFGPTGQDAATDPPVAIPAAPPRGAPERDGRLDA